jgi:hypothetical protein
MATITIKIADVLYSNPAMTLRALTNKQGFDRTELVIKVLNYARKDIHSEVQEEQEFVLVLVKPNNQSVRLRFRRLKNDDAWDDELDGGVFTKKSVYCMVVQSLDFELTWKAPQYQCAAGSSFSFKGPSEAWSGLKNKISGTFSNIAESWNKMKDEVDLEKKFDQFR